MTIAQYFNEKFEDFKDILLRPQQGARSVSRKASLAAGAKMIALFGFIAGFFSILLMAVGGLIGSIVALLVGGTAADLITAAFGAIIMVIAYVVVFVPAIIGYLLLLIVWCGMVWGFAKALGGHADYGKHFGTIAYPLTLCFAVSFLLVGVLNLLGAIALPVAPIVSEALVWVELLLVSLFSLFVLWLVVVGTSEAHQINLLKAAASVIVPSGVLGLGIAIVLVVFGTLAATMLGLLPLGSLPF